MAQVKKARVRDAIIGGAYKLFRKQSYLGTSVADIGRAAGVAPSNVYVYFNSKFEIFYAVYEPWLNRRLARLEQDLEDIDGPDQKLQHIVQTIWVDLPAEDNGFANNLMQAVSTTDKDETFRSDVLSRAEAALSDLLRRALPDSRHDLIENHRLAHILLMAFDGFVVRHHVGGTRPDMQKIVDIMTLLIAGEAASRAGAPKAKARIARSKSSASAPRAATQRKRKAVAAR
jgi:AcrR family transcriptional regulator